MVVAILAREKADATGCADGVLRDGCITAHAFASHAVEVWGLHIGMAFVAEDFGVVLVCDDEEDVGTVGHVIFQD